MPVVTSHRHRNPSPAGPGATTAPDRIGPGSPPYPNGPDVVAVVVPAPVRRRTTVRRGARNRFSQQRRAARDTAGGPSCLAGQVTVR